MKRGVVITLAVAILGALSTISKDKPASSTGYGSGMSTTPVSQINNTNANSQSIATSYKDGIYTGSSADNPYGTVQIAAVISSGKITDIKFLQMPSHQGHSQEVTNFSEPLLKQSAISKQSANIDFVSGATDTSYGFEQSLQAALDQAA